MKSLRYGLFPLLFFVLISCEQWLPVSDYLNLDEDSVILAIENPDYPAPQIDIPIIAIDAGMIKGLSDKARWHSLHIEAESYYSGADSVLILAGLSQIPYSPNDLRLTLDMNNPHVIALFPYELPDTIDFSNGDFYLTSLAYCLKFDPNSPLGNLYRSYDLDQQPLLNLKTTYQGGCCATLSVAHSLVRRLRKLVNLADVTDSVTVKRWWGPHREACWKPDFLKKIYENSGDTDGDRSLYSDQMATAHTADYNDKWVCEQFVDGEILYNDELFIDCDELNNRWNKLRYYLMLKNDVIMSIDGIDRSTGKKFGHAVYVEDVIWKAAPDCAIHIDIIPTSIQDPDCDFKKIPFNPGKRRYTISNANLEFTWVINDEFPGWKVTSLTYDAFRKKEK